MTFEEKKAVEYTDSVEEKKHWSDEYDSNTVFTREEVEQAYIAGYKEALKVRINTTSISDAPLMEKEQLAQAKKLLKEFCSYYMYDCDAIRKDCEAFEELKRKAEQFLEE